MKFRTVLKIHEREEPWNKFVKILLSLTTQSSLKRPWVYITKIWSYSLLLIGIYFLYTLQKISYNLFVGHKAFIDFSLALYVEKFRYKDSHLFRLFTPITRGKIRNTQRKLFIMRIMFRNIELLINSHFCVFLSFVLDFTFSFEDRTRFSNLFLVYRRF